MTEETTAAEATPSVEEEVPQEEEEVLLKDLVVLPPRQRETPSSEFSLQLPILRPSEHVQSIRSALAEVVTFAHITNYRLEVEFLPEKWESTSEPLQSYQYTGTNAYIASPENAPADLLLAEYGNLSPIVEQEITGKEGIRKCAIRMVLERYTLGGIKEHVQKLRFLLQDNAPSIKKLTADTNEMEEKREKTNLPSSLGDLSVQKLSDFFYLASGESRDLYDKNGKKKPESAIRDKLIRLNKLEEIGMVPCLIRYSGYAPPPRQRQLIGDLTYLECKIDDKIIHVTATNVGFYVNKTTDTFDPRPASEPCFSHTLLDCLIQASETFKAAWTKSLDAATERGNIHQSLGGGVFQSLFRLSIRGDLPGFSSAANAMKAFKSFEATTYTSSWLQPLPRSYKSDWTNAVYHDYSLDRIEDEVSKMETKLGTQRDWNEELQLARELPMDTVEERLERGRMIHKVLTEFGETAVAGVKNIAAGMIRPMNPDEPWNQHFFLSENIFYSLALDNGAETFKIAEGNRAAKKSAGRDIQCISTFHRMDNPEIRTLATALVDYQGIRYLCQSVLPGIMVNEKSHELVLGAVDSKTPLKNDSKLQKELESSLEGLMVATRPVYTQPSADSSGGNGSNDVMLTCAPIEAKGIVGSDKRCYILDYGRFTPRDPNWINKGEGGTGKWESVTVTSPVPSSLKDDEWTMSILRPELITKYVQTEFKKFKQAQLEKDEKSKDENEPEEEPDENELKKIKEEDEKFLNTLRVNVNVFLPGLRKFEDEELSEQLKKDEEYTRKIASFLWDELLPRITQVVREGSLSHFPNDGAALTEFVHRNGINCRYFGRLAQLAILEEAKDRQTDDDLSKGRLTVISRNKMPLCWLEMLETEMVARAAKHVLDGYLAEGGGIVANRSSQTVASFLSSLISISEETAAETENRMSKSSKGEPDEEEFLGIAVSDVGGDGDALPPSVRSRHEVWQDIEFEVGRRFRYNLTLYNKEKTPRAIYSALLRRVCYRSGITLVAKDYELGGKCLTSLGSTDNGRMSPSYPISPIDIVDIVPMVKNAASHGEGFFRSSTIPSGLGQPLHVSTADARAILEQAHVNATRGAFKTALEYAQHAIVYYQRVVDSAAHPGVVQAHELLASILVQIDQPDAALAHASRALGLTVQLYGFDSHQAVSLHMRLASTYFSLEDMEKGIKHLKAVVFLCELLGGPNHIEYSSTLFQLSGLFANDKAMPSKEIADKIFNTIRKTEYQDRIMDGVVRRSYANNLSALGEYKDALEEMKAAVKQFSIFVKDSKILEESNTELAKLEKLAADQGNKRAQRELLAEEASRADKIAAELMKEEEKATNKKMNKKKKGSKK